MLCGKIAEGHPKLFCAAHLVQPIMLCFTRWQEPGRICLVGETKNSRSKHAWRQVYRALEHGKAKKDCRNKKITKRFPSGIRNFCDAFVLMQELRQKADYDPYTEFGNPLTKFFVEDNIDRAERVIKDFNSASKKDRRAFSTYVLFKTYPS